MANPLFGSLLYVETKSSIIKLFTFLHYTFDEYHRLKRKPLRRQNVEKKQTKNYLTLQLGKRADKKVIYFFERVRAIYFSSKESEM